MYSSNRHFCGEGPRSAIRYASLNTRSRPNEPRVWFSALTGSKIIILQHQHKLNPTHISPETNDRPQITGCANHDDSRLTFDAL